MITFDDILDKLRETLDEHRELIEKLGTLVINRDLSGRVTLIADERFEENEEHLTLMRGLGSEVAQALGPHAREAATIWLYEPKLERWIERQPKQSLEDFERVYVVDRLVMQGEWSSIAEPRESTASRIVFYSVKGGVGRSTALAVAAWSRAQEGKKVLVLDLDLESPGLSASLLQESRRPRYGTVDWLLEDLVQDADELIGDMVTPSDLDPNGNILVVPAHGNPAGEYIAKLGRAFMSKRGTGGLEFWSSRLARLLQALERRYRPDVVLIDSRSGLDEISCAILSALEPECILCFSTFGDQSRHGYEFLFDYWRRMDVAGKIRERLQAVGAMIPSTHGQQYLEDLRQQSFDLYQTLYDEVPAGVTDLELFSFDVGDEAAPHSPWPIRWSEGFSSLGSYSRFETAIKKDAVQHIFGDFLTKLFPDDQEP